MDEGIHKVAGQCNNMNDEMQISTFTGKHLTLPHYLKVRNSKR